MKKKTLKFYLKDGTIITIPNVEESFLDDIKHDLYEFGEAKIENPSDTVTVIYRGGLSAITMENYKRPYIPYKNPQIGEEFEDLDA